MWHKTVKGHPEYHSVGSRVNTWSIKHAERYLHMHTWQESQSLGSQTSWVKGSCPSERWGVEGITIFLITIVMNLTALKSYNIFSLAPKAAWKKKSQNIRLMRGRKRGWREANEDWEQDASCEKELISWGISLLDSPHSSNIWLLISYCVSGPMERVHKTAYSRSQRAYRQMETQLQHITTRMLMKVHTMSMEMEEGEDGSLPRIRET